MGHSLLILSAAGRDSFTHDQLARLDEAASVCYHVIRDRISASEFVAIAGETEYLGITRRPLEVVTAAVLDSMPELRGIAIYATGYEWLDWAALKRRDIKLAYLPDYSTSVVAEHALGMMLAMSRRIHVSHDRTRGIIPITTSLRGFELTGRTLGIVGMGKIGSRVAELAHAFGMAIIYCDIQTVEAAVGRQVQAQDLWRGADMIVIAASQTNEMRAIVTERELSLAKPDAILINISRSSLVDNNAVLDALRNKKLRGYAVDDHVAELSAATDLEPGRLLQTGHSAWYSDEAISRGTEEWVQNMIALVEGRSRNLVVKE